jgi:flagellar motility protein MotE (MotC chaperone)
MTLATLSKIPQEKIQVLDQWGKYTILKIETRVMEKYSADDANEYRPSKKEERELLKLSREAEELYKAGKLENRNGFLATEYLNKKEERELVKLFKEAKKLYKAGKLENLDDFLAIEHPHLLNAHHAH